MPDKRLFHTTITHKIAIYAESHTDAEKIARSHLHDKLAEWPLSEELAHSSDILSRQVPISNSELLPEGYLDVPPYSDDGETRTCKEILKDEEDERKAKVEK